MMEKDPLEIKLPEIIEEEDVEVKNIPQYHVILLDDDEHTYEYVIEMLVKIFGHSESAALNMAMEVDGKGRVVVNTTFKERADHNRRQIEGYGPDWRIAHSSGSMSAYIEPAE